MYRATSCKTVSSAELYNHLFVEISFETNFPEKDDTEERVGQFLKQAETPPRCWFTKNKNQGPYFSIFFVSKTGQQVNFLVMFVAF